MSEQMTTTGRQTTAAAERASGMARRSFLKVALGFSFAATALGTAIPIVGYLWPPERAGTANQVRTLAGTLKEIPVGQAKILPVNDKPVIVVNTAAGGIKAFSAICTHLGCIVYWDTQKGVIHSPCHDGLFNPVTGAVISGPPPRPLPAYELEIEGENIYIGKPLGELYKA